MGTTFRDRLTRAGRTATSGSSAGANTSKHACRDVAGVSVTDGTRKIAGPAL